MFQSVPQQLRRNNKWSDLLNKWSDLLNKWPDFTQQVVELAQEVVGLEQKVVGLAQRLVGLAQQLRRNNKWLDLYNESYKSATKNNAREEKGMDYDED